LHNLLCSKLAVLEENRKAVGQEAKDKHNILDKIRAMSSLQLPVDIYQRLDLHKLYMIEVRSEILKQSKNLAVLHKIIYNVFIYFYDFVDFFLR
jgi:hypothetical protein